MQLTKGDDIVDEENFYSQAMREFLIEEGAINNEEDGFMKGYEEGLNDFGEEDDDDLEWGDLRGTFL